MKAFITYPTYRIVKDNSGKETAQVWLFGRLENGQSFLAKNSFRPYFWIRKADKKHALKINKAYAFDMEEPGFKDFKGDEMVKVLLDTPKQVPELRRVFESNRIVCSEADIRFSYRFMMDNDILGSCDIRGKHEKGEFVDRIYDEPAFKKAYWYPRLRILSFDIETTPDAKELLSISMHGMDYSEVFVLSDMKLKRAVSFASEKELLLAFRDKVQELDPDILLGWNVVGFDLNVLHGLFSKHGIPFVLGRTGDECKLRIFQDFFRDSTADVPGRQVLDGIVLLKTSFVALDDYKLSTAAKAFVGDDKLIGDENKWEQIQSAYENDPQLFVDYNLKDSVLALAVAESSGTLALTIQRSLLTGMPLERVKASVASLDSLYLRELRKIRVVAPSSSFAEKDKPTKGGFVMTSKPGIYDNILVHDFKSLYPSIIRTFNIDPYSFLGVGVEGSKQQVVRLVNGACFRNQEGILPMLIQRLWWQRDKAKKEKNMLASKAIKILMNSFYGVLANNNCRFFSPDMANAITHTGQHLIKLSAEQVKAKGYEVIYGDTDSVFTNSGTSDYNKAERIGIEIQSLINNFYEDHITEEYARKNFMELEFEKVFKKFLMPTVRGSTTGAKKRYAGIVVEDGKEKLVFTGLEFVRSDWTGLAKKFQMGLLDRIFKGEEVTLFVRDFVKDLKDGKYDGLLVYRKSIRKDLASYTKTTPPHVKAARKLEDAGIKLESSIIRYVMTENGPEPINFRKGRIDYDHYIEKQVRPLADSILGFYGVGFDDLLKGNSQKTLAGF